VELLQKIRIEYERYSDHFIDPIFLSNHDNNRILSDLGNNISKAKLAACIYLTLPGTPFIYYGEEIGMRGRKPDSLIREPFLWAAEGKDKNQTLWAPRINSSDTAVAPLSKQLDDPSSIYHHYKQLIALRKGNAALTSHSLSPIDLKNDKLLAYTRGEGTTELVVIHNLSKENLDVELPVDLTDFRKTPYSSDKKNHLSKNKITLAAYATIIISKK
jgi:alpha-amylase